MAGLCSNKPDVIRGTFAKLREDYGIFLVAQGKQDTNTLIRKLVKSSPFSTRVMREVCVCCSRCPRMIAQMQTGKLWS